MMLVSFKPKKENIEQFKQKVDDLNSKIENEFQIFLNELHTDLVSTIDQHDHVKLKSKQAVSSSRYKDLTKRSQDEIIKAVEDNQKAPIHLNKLTRYYKSLQVYKRK